MVSEKNVDNLLHGQETGMWFLKRIWTISCMDSKLVCCLREECRHSPVWTGNWYVVSENNVDNLLHGQETGM